MVKAAPTRYSIDVFVLGFGGNLRSDNRTFAAGVHPKVRTLRKTASPRLPDWITAHRPLWPTCLS